MRLSKPKSLLRSLLLVLTASLLFLCASCGGSNPPELSKESPSPSDLHVADTPTPLPSPIPSPSPEKSPVPDDPFANKSVIYHLLGGADDPDYPLVAMIPQEDIYLYGIRAD